MLNIKIKFQPTLNVKTEIKNIKILERRHFYELDMNKVLLCLIQILETIYLVGGFQTVNYRTLKDPENFSGVHEVRTIFKMLVKTSFAFSL